MKVCNSCLLILVIPNDILWELTYGLWSNFLMEKKYLYIKIVILYKLVLLKANSFC